MSSLPAHVAAANAKQGREWREDEARKHVRWHYGQRNAYRNTARDVAEDLLADHRPADLLAALRTVSGEEEFGADPGRAWIERVTEAVEDLISDEGRNE